MYRQSAQLHMGTGMLPSPAPDDLSDDSESEIVAELDKKRRLLDKEIVKFKEQKDKEFHQFEKELRSKQRIRTSSSTAVHDPPSLKTPHSNSASSLFNLFASKKPQSNGVAAKEPRPSNGLLTPKTRPTPLPSKPTISLDKLNINGTTTPPVSGTPPTLKSFSRSPPHLSVTPPRRTRSPLAESPNSPPRRGRSPQGHISSAPHDREAEFRGLFTPVYLPLLDCRTSSLPHDTIPPQGHGRRTLTAPVLPSTSLPSALRTASGNVVRKIKHVTFQLADQAIVEPSSSYEEIPSPAPPIQEMEDKIDQMMKDATKEQQSDGLLSPRPGDDDPVGAEGGNRSGLRGTESVENEASFFSFDEELDDLGDYPPPPHLDPDPDEDHAGKVADGREDEELQSGSFSAGSLPINIVRPGSFR